MPPTRRWGLFALNRLQSFGQVRAIDEEARRVTSVVSTGNIARDGAVIEMGGWQFDNYDRNPVVLWAHDDRSLPIARSVGREMRDNELVQVHEFANHPRAQEVYEAVRDGFVNATSVRWNPVAYEWRKVDGRDVLVFTRSDLLEVSYVPVPADPGAVVLRANGDPLDLTPFMPAPVHEAEKENPVARFLAGFTKGKS